MPKPTHYQDLGKIADEHMKLRGIIDALVLFDQHPPKDFEAWRLRADTLHWVMEVQLTEAEKALHVAILSDPDRARRQKKGAQ
jgi:hypothetical protein